MPQSAGYGATGGVVVCVPHDQRRLGCHVAGKEPRTDDIAPRQPRVDTMRDLHDGR
jgi:hypothetical protein